MLGHDLLGAANAAGIECVGLAHAELDIADAAEVAAAVRSAAPDVVVNLQGDNPACPPWFLSALVDAFGAHPDAATALLERVAIREV